MNNIIFEKKEKINKLESYFTLTENSLRSVICVGRIFHRVNRSAHPAAVQTFRVSAKIEALTRNRWAVT